MFFKKKDSHINIYEAHADELLYDLWAKRDKLTAQTREVITRKSVIDLYPDGADRNAAIKECEKAKRSLLCAISAYDTSRIEYNDYITKTPNGLIIPVGHGQSQAMTSLLLLIEHIFKIRG